ncbi:MAG: GlsB/YeaQ/YmgE family stress response membrane protein [Planctomycetaceae bacterium]|nr:GlsB/YeaQ/YmgE family stress response membrane protein [Planctomycetaceae bacterium]
MHIIGTILIGGISGWLAGRITKGKGFGVLGNILVGIIGAAVGGLLFSLLQLNASGTIGHIITSTTGAVVFLFLLRKLKS